YERMSRLQAYGESDRGRIKRNNEDSLDYYIDRSGSLALAVVADGVGGTAGGEVASELAVRTVIDRLRRALTPELAERPHDLAAMLGAAIEQANEAILLAQARMPTLANMATTIVALLTDARTLAVAHVGDSRCYRLRAGRLTALTADHTVAQEMLEKHGFSPAALVDSPYHQVLSQALGTEPPPAVTISEHPWRAGDLYLLCSDGLTRHLNEHAIAQILLSAASLPAAAAALIDAANAA